MWFPCQSDCSEREPPRASGLNAQRLVEQLGDVPDEQGPLVAGALHRVLEEGDLEGTAHREHLRAEGSLYKTIRESGELTDETDKKLRAELDRFANTFNVEQEEALVS